MFPSSVWGHALGPCLSAYLFRSHEARAAGYVLQQPFPLIKMRFSHHQTLSSSASWPSTAVRPNVKDLLASTALARNSRELSITPCNLKAEPS